MAEFLDELQLAFPGNQVARLTAPLRYRADDGRVFTVPVGFETDLASVPVWLKWLAPPDWRSARAGTLHDCGYRWFEVWKESRGKLDRHFYDGLRADGVGWLRARGMQAAVVLFGQVPWDNWRSTPASAKGVQPTPPS